MKTIILTMVLSILLCVPAYGRRFRRQCQPQLPQFEIVDIVKGEVETNIQIQWRCFTITKRMYSKIEVTKAGLKITGIIYTRKGVPIVSVIVVPWADMVQEVRKELKSTIGD